MVSALASLSGIALRGRSVLAAASIALTLPVFAVEACANAYADRLGDCIAAWMIAVVPSLPLPPAPEESDEVPGGATAFLAAPVDKKAVTEGKRSQKAIHPRPTPKQGIRITSAQVLALATRRAMPNAVFVKANAEHPAGLQLNGVSALRVGLQDGDVLTEAAGQKATSVAQVVGIVLAARSRQASEISGRFYRGAVPFSLTVEQPYPNTPVPG